MTESRRVVNEAFDNDRGALALRDLDQATDENLNSLLTTLIEHDRVRFAALKPLVRLSVNSELNRIEQAFSSLEMLSQQSKQNQFINPQSITLLRAQLVSAQEAFFVTEAVDCSEARNVA